ncbi:hypothetical protein BKA61DRAFT_646780 [Leptodontidium sp. MPI-SDFR-AT-0119]|nr:hypothetical protein BKA61DRAFT_646780 [Leptodontidium sp. MPI-SDFR-AT-0119]
MAEVNGGDVPQTNGHPSASPPSLLRAAPSQPAPITIPPPTIPLTSPQDNSLNKRPRDARLMHMLLSSLGCTAYQIKSAHSISILSDVLRLSFDAFISQQTRAWDAPPGGGFREADGQVSANAVLLAIQSRLQYQFSGGNGGRGLSKEFLLGMAQQRNEVTLPRVLRNEWGVRLPSEKFVLTGVLWGLKGEWGVDDEETMQGDGMEGEGGTMEDLFGGDPDPDPDMDKMIERKKGMP